MAWQPSTGWEVLAVIHDRDDRDADSCGAGFTAALDVLARDADTLAVTALDDLAGSVAQVAELLERAPYKSTRPPARTIPTPPKP